MASNKVSKLSLGSKGLANPNKQLPISSFFDSKKKCEDIENIIDICSDEDELSFMGCSSISSRSPKPLAKTQRSVL